MIGNLGGGVPLITKDGVHVGSIGENYKSRVIKSHQKIGKIEEDVLNQ